MIEIYGFFCENGVCDFAVHGKEICGCVVCRIGKCDGAGCGCEGYVNVICVCFGCVNGICDCASCMNGVCGSVVCVTGICVSVCNGNGICSFAV